MADGALDAFYHCAKSFSALIFKKVRKSYRIFIFIRGLNCFFNSLTLYFKRR
jgi:hypothetical protein